MIGMIAGRGRGAAVATLVLLAMSTGVWLGSRARPEVVAAPLAPDQAVEARLAAAQVWIPAMGASRAGCEGRLVLQNLSSAEQRGVLVTWGDSCACPPSSAGPLHIACTGLIAPHGSWILQGAQLGAGSRSGTVYSFVDLPGNGLVDVACEAPFAWLKGEPQEYRRFQQAFLSNGRYRNFIFERMVADPLAVSWTERCGDALSSHNALRWGEASAWSEPEQAQLSFLPLIDADWEILVQNMGLDCADAALRLDLGDGRSTVCEMPRIAPGEARSISVADCSLEALSATVSATQPIAVVARRAAEGPRAAYAGRGFGGPEIHLPWPGDQRLAAVVGLKNPSPTLTATVRLQADDRWGKRRLLREARLGPGAALRLDLSAAELGSVSDCAFLRVESLADDQGGRAPIVGAIWQQRDGVTIAAQELLVGTPDGAGAGLLALPSFQRGPAATTQIVVHNDVDRFGHTGFMLALSDRNGFLDVICKRLDARSSKVIDLNIWHFTSRGFVGSAVISAENWEHDRDDSGRKLPDNPVGLSASVWTRGEAEGDPDLLVGLAMPAGSYRRVDRLPVNCRNAGPRLPTALPSTTPTPTSTSPSQAHPAWLPLLFRGR